MKSIEEAAKEYSDYEEGEYVFKSGIEFAQRWITVEEELPFRASDSENRWNNTHGFSLPVITKNDEFMPTYYKIQSYNVELKAWQTSEKVTHWRPIELR